jgi:glycosyltransferase involved in cell wall biosynthesis
MSEYLLREVDLASPVAGIALPPASKGVALIVRNAGRLAGFRMFPCAPRQLTPEQVEALARSAIDELDEPEYRPRDRRCPPVTVAICTRNRAPLLRRAISHLVALRPGPGQSPHEILIVDNASIDDQSRQVAREFPGVRYVREPRPGLSFARNRAALAASGEFVAYLDDDAVVDRMWMTGLAEACDENPDAGAFSGPILPFELATRSQVLLEGRGGFGHAFRKVRWTAEGPGGPLFPCGEACAGGGGNMVLRRSLLLDLGGFDEALGAGTPAEGAEDLDIFYRVVSAGHAWVYEPQLAIHHQHRREHRQVRRQVRSWGIGYTAYVQKWLRPGSPDSGRFRQVRNRLIIRKFGGVAASLLGIRRYPWPAGYAFSEVVGLIQGLLGAYPRSLRYAERVRLAVAVADATPIMVSEGRS